MKLLKVQDLKLWQEYKFYFKLSNKLLPEYFATFTLMTNEGIHSYETRNKKDVHKTFTKYEFVKKWLKNKLVNLINECPLNIKSKVNTHSYQGFSLYVKNQLINKYFDTCAIINCYVCRRNYWTVNVMILLCILESVFLFRNAIYVINMKYCFNFSGNVYRALFHFCFMSFYFYFSLYLYKVKQKRIFLVIVWLILETKVRWQLW